MCPPLANFKFLDCSNIESDEDDDAQSNANNQNGFTFNLDASLPSDEPEDCNGANYVNVQDDNEDIVHVELQRPLKKIVDLREVVSSNTMSTPSEYSFIPSSCSLHWAGPSHWKIRNLTRIGGSRIEGACQQEQIKKRKELELCYDDTVIERIMPKFIISKFTTLKGAKLKWTEEALTLPRDMYYDITNANKLYLHELITICPTEEDELNATHVSDDMLNYNYNNENDTSYCPNVPNEDYEEHEIDNNRNGVENVNAEELLPSTGDNLVAVPKLTNKIAITYNTRAKKVDMRQLKTAICKVIDDNNNQGNASTENGEDQEKNEEKGTNLHFSEVYKALPNLLTTNNAEALSFPIGFVSLLHVANEKNLKLESNPEMSDIIITKS